MKVYVGVNKIDCALQITQKLYYDEVNFCKSASDIKTRPKAMTANVIHLLTKKCVYIHLIH